MSASNERNTARTAREKQQRKEERRSKIMYGVIGAAFVLVAAATLIWKSNIIQKSATAATLNGQKYSVAEVSYYYQTAYQSFVTQNSYLLSYIGLEPGKPLKDQQYSEEQTWRDYFLEQGLNQLAATAATLNAAEAAGFTWTGELQAELDASVDSLDAAAQTRGYTLPQYLKLVFGSTMTEKVYRAQLQDAMLASAYASDYVDANFVYDAAALDAAYQADRNKYDVVDYESVRISGSVPNGTDADGNPVEPTEEETAAAMADAKKLADGFLAQYRTGGDLSALADTEAAATYTESESGAYADNALMNWLFDTSRKAGDSAVVADEAGSAYSVAVFHERGRHDYNTVNVRHILIEPAAGTIKEGEEGYDAEQAALKADAKAKADGLLAQWQSGEATEDSFAALAGENSSDGGSNTNGGLYESVYQGQMVETFNDWCFDSGRKTGDTGVVETDYGYHVIYFVGTGDPYWQIQVRNTLQNSDYTAWYGELTKDYQAEQSSGVKYVS